MGHLFPSLCVHVQNNTSFFLDVISGPHYKVRSSVIVTLALHDATDTFAGKRSWFRSRAWPISTPHIIPTWQQKKAQPVLFIWHYFLSLFIGKGKGKVSVYAM